jgi:hypothetical protein
MQNARTAVLRNQAVQMYVSLAMLSGSKWIALCYLATLVALYVVGAVSHGVLRHAVQTLPLWFPILFGFRGSELAKWSALPCLIFWLGIMVLIWLFLMGWSHIASGQYSAVEIAMTLVVGAACLLGAGVALRWRTTVRPLPAAAIVVLFSVLQVLALWVSLLPSIAYR